MAFLDSSHFTRRSSSCHHATPYLTSVVNTASQGPSRPGVGSRRRILRAAMGGTRRGAVERHRPRSGRATGCQGVLGRSASRGVLAGQGSSGTHRTHSAHRRGRTGRLEDASAALQPRLPVCECDAASNRNFRRDVFDAAVEARDLDITPHKLRDTAASLAIQAGASVVAVARLLGHESAATTLNH